MPGRPLVSDFDGTLARLELDWQSLRADLGVETISALWDGPLELWDTVSRAEVASAAVAVMVADGFERAVSASATAILTNNSEACVEAFLQRFPDLAGSVCVVIGRETLGGPKNDRAVFEVGYGRALEALGLRLGSPIGAVEFQGDQDYELAFAAALGADVFDVRSGGDSPAPASL